MSSMCRVFSPAHTSHWHPTPPFQPLPAPLQFPGASNSAHPRPRHHVSQPAPPSTQHQASHLVSKAKSSSCLTCSLPRPANLRSTHCPRASCHPLLPPPASVLHSTARMIFLRHKYKQLLPKAFSRVTYHVGQDQAWGMRVSPPFHLLTCLVTCYPLQTHPGIRVCGAVLAYTLPGPLPDGAGIWSHPCLR